MTDSLKNVDASIAVKGHKDELLLRLHLELSKAEFKEFRSDDYLDLCIKLRLLYGFINEAKISSRFKKKALEDLIAFRDAGKRFDFESDSAGTKVFSLSPKAVEGAKNVLATFDRISYGVTDLALVTALGKLLLEMGIKKPV